MSETPQLVVVDAAEQVWRVGFRPEPWAWSGWSGPAPTAGLRGWRDPLVVARDKVGGERDADRALLRRDSR